MGAFDEMMCDGCVLASTLCKYTLSKGDLFVLSWAKGGTSDAGKYLFRAVVVRLSVWSISVLSLPPRDS